MGFAPAIRQLAPANNRVMGSEVDVLIVGCGPAGLTLAAQLSTLGNVSVRIAERKPGPLEVGQADGVACRSIEMFEGLWLFRESHQRGLSRQRSQLLAPGNGWCAACPRGSHSRRRRRSV